MTSEESVLVSGPNTSAASYKVHQQTDVVLLIIIAAKESDVLSIRKSCSLVFVLSVSLQNV